MDVLYDREKKLEHAFSPRASTDSAMQKEWNFKDFPRDANIQSIHECNVINVKTLYEKQTYITYNACIENEIAKQKKRIERGALEEANS